MDRLGVDGWWGGLMKTRYVFSCAIAALLSGGAGMTVAAEAPSAPAAGSAALISAGAAGAAPAADASAGPAPVEEVVVTAQRRSENIERVPATIQAFTGQTLSQLNVNSLNDILKFTPNVTLATNGPGQGNIFLRGLSTGFAGNQSSAAVGQFPNVAIYLDDQSFQFPSRNVDIYVADIQRVEVLEGPQGTLFGGGAEAGALRYITNKPKLGVTEGNAEGEHGFTAGGDDNTKVTATLNVPIGDNFAVRAVVYDERQGGYINNEPSTFTRSNSDLGNYYFNIRPNAGNGLCPNRLPPGAAGLCTLAGAPQANNFAQAKDAFNPTTYVGGRISALYKVNDDWDVLIAQSVQKLNADGLYDEYPTGSDFQPLKPLQVTAFAPSFDDDKFENTAWTINGKLKDLRLVYTGGYTVRNIDQQQDYTNYSRTGGGIYYQCTGGTGGLFGGATQPLNCNSPIGFWRDTVKNTHFSNEFRVSTPDTWRLRGIGGVYYEDFKIDDVQNFNYKTIPACSPANLAAALNGGQTCVADVRTAPNSTANDPGIRNDTTAFGEDLQRGYKQLAFFTSLDFDIIPNRLTVTGGARFFQYSEFEVGSQYATGAGCVDVPNGDCTGGLTNINNARDKKVYTGFRSRASILGRLTPTTSVYYTFSQGFRPGGFNRAVSAVAKDANGDPQYERPNSYSPDQLTNNEIGLKTELFEHRLQVNLSAYYENWDNVQVNFYDPTVLGNTSFATNGPNYDIKGVEAQIVAHPLEGLTVQGSASYNHDTQSNSPALIDNIPSSPGFGKPITQVIASGSGLVSFANPFGAPGTTPAFSPDFKANLRVRYDWAIRDYKAFAQVGGSYTGSEFNQPATSLSGDGVLIPNTTLLRYFQPAYAIADASFGIAKDHWTAEVYGTNLNDSHASTFTSSAQFIKSEVPLRPLVVALKIGYSF